MQQPGCQLEQLIGNLTNEHLAAGLPVVPGILQAIQHHLKLEAVCLKLFLNPDHPGLTLHSPGPDRYRVTPKATTNEHQILTSGNPERVGRELTIPLPRTPALHGLLQLTDPVAQPVVSTGALSPSLLQLLLLALRHEMPNQDPNSAALQTLANAKTLPQLARQLVQTTLRRFGTVAAMVRPLHGGTLLGERSSHILPGSRKWASLLCDLEEEQVARLLRSPTHPLLNRLDQSPYSPQQINTLLSVPLKFDNQLLGLLTLFGGGWGRLAELSPEKIDLGKLSEVIQVVTLALERLSRGDQVASMVDHSSRSQQENSILFRMSKALQSTLRVDELSHLILSAAVRPEGGGFERALLFMHNERSGSLQGMLGITRDSAALVFPDAHPGTWERPQLNEAVQQAQRQTDASRMVMKQRLFLDQENHPLVKAIRLRRVVFEPNPETSTELLGDLLSELELGPFACTPFIGRGRIFGVMVVDNPQSREPITPERLRFLELFAGLAGTAMENGMLLYRLETAHRDLLVTQEQLLQGEKLAVLGEMAASVAHELKNPLVMIGGFAKRMTHLPAGDQRQGEYATIIAREVARMELLLGEILNFSRRQVLCFSDCDIPDLLSEAIDNSAHFFDQETILLRRQDGANLPIIKADPLKLRQVIVNLISNACQAMGTKGELDLSSYNDLLRGDPAVTIRLEDTGAGISENILRNIFNPFFTTKEKGTGVGLSICHRIVEHHNGLIQVKNTDRGACFEITLPVHQNAPQPVDKLGGFG